MGKPVSHSDLQAAVDANQACTQSSLIYRLKGLDCYCDEPDVMQADVRAQ